MPDIDAVVRAIDPKKLSAGEYLEQWRELAFSDVDLSAVDPNNFARLLAHASKEQIQRVLAEPTLRAHLLHEVFRRMETYFRPDRAGTLRAVMRFQLNGDTYNVSIEDGRCSVSQGLEGTPRSTVTIDPVEFLKLATATANATVLFMMGKLKSTGDLVFAARFMSLFDIPKPR